MPSNDIHVRTGIAIPGRTEPLTRLVRREASMEPSRSPTPGLTTKGNAKQTLLLYGPIGSQGRGRKKRGNETRSISMAVRRTGNVEVLVTHCN